jgi:hypothetical protein
MPGAEYGMADDGTWMPDFRAALEPDGLRHDSNPTK